MAGRYVKCVVVYTKFKNLYTYHLTYDYIQLKVIKKINIQWSHATVAYSYIHVYNTR